MGYRGQLAHGTGNGAEGILTELAGLYELGHGLGAAGRGFGPGEGDTGDGDLHGALGGPAEAAPFFQVGQGQVQMVLLEADRSSWVTTRQSLRAQSHVNPASVAVEDFINALDYGETPTVGVQLTAQVAAHPAEPDLLLMRVGVLVGHGARVPADVTLVVDDSCSMEGVEDLARETTRALVQGLNPDDRVRLAPLNAPSTKLLSPDEPALLKAVDQLAATGGSPIAMGLTNALDLAAKDPRHGHVILITDGESTGIADAAAAAWEAGLGFSIVVVDDRGWGRGVRELERAGLVGGSVVHRVDSSEEAERIGSIAGQLVSPLELPGLEVRFDVEGVKSSRLFGYGSRNVMAVEGGTGDGEPVRPGAVGPGNVVSVLFELEVHTGVDRIGSIELPGMAEPLEVHLGDGDPRLARLAYAAGGFAESLQGSKFRTASLGQLGRIVDTDRFNPSHRDLRELLMLAMRSY